MCTDNELRTKIRMYCEISAEKSKLEKLQKELSAFIRDEMDRRNETITDPKQKDCFEGKQVITSRLRESATKDGLQYLKKSFTEDIDKYVSVTLSRYVNTAAAKKI